MIVDSVNIKTKAFEKIYKPFGNSVAKSVVSHHNSNLGMSRYEKFEFYHKTFLGKELSSDQLKALSIKFQKLVCRKVIEAPLIKGAMEFLNKFNGTIPMYIVSATPDEELCFIVEEKGLSKYFKGIYGAPKDKDYWTKLIIKKKNYNYQKMIFVGDGLKDYEAAIKNNLNFIGRVESKSENIFKDKKIDYLINDLRYLENSIKSIFND